MKFLSYDDLRALGIRYSRVHLWRLRRAGKFPPPIKLSSSRIVWADAAIDAWMAEKAGVGTQGGAEA
jgi:prophage regulatory protein